MSDILDSRRVLVARVLGGEGTTIRDHRQAAFDNAGLAEPMRTLVEKVAKHAYKVTDDDVAAAIGQAVRQHDHALAALDAATGKA